MPVTSGSQQSNQMYDPSQPYVTVSGKNFGANAATMDPTQFAQQYLGYRPGANGYGTISGAYAPIESRNFGLGGQVSQNDITNAATWYQNQIKSGLPAANAAAFRNSIPSLQNSMVSRLARSTSQQLGSNLQQIQSGNSSRGMGYGGVNQGQQQQARGQSAQAMAGGVSDINSGLQTAANQLDQATIQNGLAIQQQQQAIQDSIYSQAMASMNANNSIVGSMLGGGMMFAGMGLMA